MPRATERDPERELLDRLRAGDEAAFAGLVERLGPAMLRLAMTFVRTRAVAEEVVQETWLGVLEGIDRFEGRSSVKTWILRILANVARTRAVREGRSLPFSSFDAAAGERGEPAVDTERFVADGPNAGAWQSPPTPWEDVPEDHLLSHEARAAIAEAIAALPGAQRTVITLRDVEGWSPAEVCNALDVSETNQRVLLHRARSKVRRALERYLGEG